MSMRDCIKPVVLTMFAALTLGSAPAGEPVSRLGVEYRMTPPMGGDQVFPYAATAGTGGVLVWQDAVTDGLGLGISARRLDANFNGIYDSFRVNQGAVGNQENARAAVLKDGGVVFVWQGGDDARPRIYARFMNAAGAFTTGDVQVNSYTEDAQVNPSATVLSNGNAVVVWSSLGQDGDMQGVFGQRFSPEGQKLGGEFQVNQTALLNQRHPVVAAQPAGGFFVLWINERYRGLSMQTNPDGSIDSTSGATLYDVQVYGRPFDAEGNPLASEAALSPSGRVAANPALAVAADGQMMIAWSGFTPYRTASVSSEREGWDVFARGLNPDGTAGAAEFRLNAHVPGDQFMPQLTVLGQRFQVVWTSLAQDGAREGVFGRTAGAAGPLGEEMQINSFTPSQQINPTVTALGEQDALVVWSSYVGGSYSFELLAQRLSAAPSLAAPTAPFAVALSASQLQVSWPPLEGMDVAGYDVYVNGATNAIHSTTPYTILTKLAPATTYSIQLAYRLADGQKSPLSPVTIGKTWDIDDLSDGLPDDWQALYWGASPAAWPSPDADSDGDGATDRQEFRAGTHPMDKQSVLKLTLEPTPQGMRLNWNTVPGCVYQVEVASAPGQWTAASGMRVATDITDSVPAGDSQNVRLYRVNRIR